MQNSELAFHSEFTGLAFFQVSLSQLGYDEPQRVCDSCAPVCEIMSKARSPQFVSILCSSNDKLEINILANVSDL